ncbi:MAG: hypothetical protein QNJ54_36920 [Prochloraceae cyanobacterium]|nr:hypothetical protein [Prochloraceae cyanobacterium]
MTTFKLEDYDVSREWGFLPTIPPASVQLPQAFQQVQETAALLPKLLITGKIRSALEDLTFVDADKEKLDQMQLGRLMQIY